jgi:hypothetical protein
MSLAMTAAPIDNNDNTNNNNIIQKKRTHNRTQRRINNIDFDNEKVNSVIESLHNNNSEGSLGDFNPIKKENMTNLENKINSYGIVPQPNEVDGTSLKTLENAFMNDDEVRRYYNKLVANYQQGQSQSQNQTYSQSQNQTYSQSQNQTYGQQNQILIDKLNYMINLLEEKKDERTNNVTEEVILYSFLGVFVIFVIDSFVRVGKYVR